MTITQVDLNTTAVYGYTHIVYLNLATDLTEADTSQTVAIFPDPTSSTSDLVGYTVSVIGVEVVTKPAGGSLSATTVEIGDDGDPNRFMTTTLGDLFITAGLFIGAAALTTAPYCYQAANTVDAIIATTGANCVDITGEIKIYLRAIKVQQ